MNILVSNKTDIDGYSLLWGASKCNALLGIDKNLFTKNGWLPEKSDKDMKINLMRNKDIKIIKLREKLFQELRDDRVWAVVDALGERDITLDKFTSALLEKEEREEIKSSGNYVEAVIGEIRDEAAVTELLEVASKNATHLAEVEEVEPIKEDCCWSAGLFGGCKPCNDEEDTEDDEEEFDNYKEEEENNDRYENPIEYEFGEDRDMEEVEVEVVTPLSESVNKNHEEVSTLSYLKGINLQDLDNDLDNLKAVRPEELVEKIEEPSETLNNNDLGEMLMEMTQNMNELSDALGYKIEAISESLNSVSDLIIQMKKDNNLQTYVIPVEKNIEEPIYVVSKEEKPVEKDANLNFAKPLNSVERGLIDRYVPNPMMIEYLRSDRAFKKQSINMETNGLYLMDGVDEVMKKGSQGFFEFLSKYFPFVFAEYENNILNKMEE